MVIDVMLKAGSNLKLRFTAINITNRNTCNSNGQSLDYYKSSNHA